MKIADAKTFVVGNPPPHHGGLYFVFVKLTTDSGIEGLGEVYSVLCLPFISSGVHQERRPVRRHW